MGDPWILPPGLRDLYQLSVRDVQDAITGEIFPLEVQFARRQAVELSRQHSHEIALQRLKQVVDCRSNALQKHSIRWGPVSLIWDEVSKCRQVF